jgi:hypothetical protein
MGVPMEASRSGGGLNRLAGYGIAKNRSGGSEERFLECSEVLNFLIVSN